MPYGVTANGFEVKPLQVIKDDLGSGCRGVFGASFDVEPESLNGQLIGVFADRLADVWQLGQAVYDAAFPDSAEGIQQDLILGLTGISRLPATNSKVIGTVTGVNGTIVLAGQLVVSVDGTGVQFENETGFTLGPSPEDRVFVAVETGPKVAPADLLTVIDTPVSGITSVTNDEDQYILGTDIETDPAARIRRELTLRAQGSAAAEAIKALVADIANVTDVVVFENETDTTDAQGVPAHSIEVVVAGGADATIAQAIFDAKAAGVGTYGTTTVTSVVGPDGLTRSVKFSRPAVLNIYHAISVRVDPALFPNDGATQIKAAVVAYGDLNMHIGTDVKSSPIIPAIFSIPGVVEVPTLPFIGLSPAPGTSTTIAVSNRQQADFDTSRVTVTVIP